MKMTSRTKFIKWYVRPFNRLKRVKNGDGAFIILSMGIALCERYFRIKSNCIKSDYIPPVFYVTAAKSFGCTADDFEIFWNVYRHGLQHRAQPQIWIKWWNKGRTKKVKTRFKWSISANNGLCPKIVDTPKGKVVCVFPNDFTYFILKKFLSDDKTLQRSVRHQFGDIYP